MIILEHNWNKQRTLQEQKERRKNMDKCSIHTRLPIELAEHFTQEANKQGVPRNTLIIQALWKIKELEEQKNR